MATILKLKDGTYDTCCICGEKKHLQYYDSELKGSDSSGYFCDDDLQWVAAADKALSLPDVVKAGICRPRDFKH
jgi:hypothetical protein